MSTIQLACQHELFDLPGDVSYLNCAYQSPKLKRSIENAATQLNRTLQPWTIASEDFFAPAERLRSLFADLISAEADDIAIVPSVSYGISTAAANLAVGPDQHIVVVSEQFPSNVYPWKETCQQKQCELRVVDRPQKGHWSDHIIDAIDSKCAVTALPGVHWTDGYRFNLEAISNRCRENGSALVLDLTQSLGVMPFSVKQTDVDFIAVASYKWLLGPLGLSFLYVNPRHHGGKPIEQGWLSRAGSDDFSRLVQYTDQFQPGARRFDSGQRTNNALIAQATTALEQVLDWSIPGIEHFLSDLTRLIALKAGQRGLVCTPESVRAPHLLGIELPEDRIVSLAAALADNRVYVSIRGNKLRLAPYLYNSERDVMRLFEVIDRCI